MHRARQGALSSLSFTVETADHDIVANYDQLLVVWNYEPAFCGAQSFLLPTGRSPDL